MPKDPPLKRAVIRGGKGRGRGGRSGPDPHPTDQVNEEVEAPAPAPAAGAKKQKLPKAAPAPKATAKAVWCSEEAAVHSCASCTDCPLPLHSPSSAQVAAHDWVAACERHSTSPETYRIQVSCDTWTAHMKTCFGVNGEGGDDSLFKVPFPTKRRAASAGGDWTFIKSCELRPLARQSIMGMGKMVVLKVLNVYIPLQDKFLVNDKLPSGWNDEDLWHAMLFHLYRTWQARNG